MHNSRIKRVTLAVCLALIPLAAIAAGLGKLTVLSGLGEPLDAEIELLSTTEAELSTLSARIAPGSVYAEQGIEMTSALSTIRVELSSKPNGTPILKLTTAQAVNDPFLDMLIRVDWASGRLLREYTALLDPPGFGDQSVSYPTGTPVGQEGDVSTSTEKAQLPPAAKKGVRHGKVGRTAAVTQEPTGHAQTESAGEEYTTKRGDTLLSIVRQIPVQGVSLERLLVGFYRVNQHAFVGKNMNRLKVGQILRSPSDDELQAIGQQEARKEVHVQTADWNNYRNKLASAVAESAPSKEEASRQSATGKIAALAEDRAMAPSTGSHDVVKLSKSDAAGPAKAGAGAESKGGKAGNQDQIAALQEEVTAREKAFKEANDRVVSLEKQIQDMKSVLELKNQSLAGGQKGVQAQKTEQTKPAVPVVVPSQGQAESPATVVAPDVQQASQKKPEGEKQKPKELIMPPSPNPVQEEPGFVDNLLASQGLLVGAIGGLIAVFGGAWIYFRNKRRKGLDALEQGILTTGGLKPNSVFGSTAGGAVDKGDTSFLSDFSHGGAGGGMIDANEVDPVAESEVYMAYGRDVQAEEILKDALVKEPKRMELRTKLLVIYANRKDTAAFETLAGELYATLGATDPAWAKIADAGRKLDPGNPLYAAKSASRAVDTSLDVTQIFQDPMLAGNGNVQHDEGVEDNAADAESSLDFSVDAGPEAGELSDSVAVPSNQAEESTLDFDIGTLDDTQHDSTFEIPVDQTAVGEAAQMPELDIPASIETDSAEAVAESVPEVVQLAEAETEETAALDFSFELPEPAAQGNDQLDAADLGIDLLPEIEEPGVTEAAEKVELESPIMPAAGEPAAGGLDFDFDVDLGEVEPSAQAKPDEASPAVPDLDLSGISLNFNESENTAAEEPGLEEITASGAESADVDTKLDLVTAYLDMGDKEGARELLQEVLLEGGPQQRERAQKLLDTLD